MSLLKIKTVALVAGLLLAGSVHANLIVNGGFEDNAVANGSWNWFPSNQVNGWEGSNVEIWHNLNGVVAPEGQQIAELNADGGNVGAWTIFQDFATVVGQSYDVSFFYRARVNDQESFNFSVGNLTKLVDDHVVGTWSKFVNTFTAVSSITQLRFSSNNAGTYGNLIDDVRVDAKVPESNTIVLFAIGLVGLGLARKRLKS